MGQYWQIILPHDRAVFESIGKLGESLFDGSPSSIVDYLAIPVTEWIDNTCNDQAFLKKKKSVSEVINTICATHASALAQSAHRQHHHHHSYLFPLKSTA